MSENKRRVASITLRPHPSATNQSDVFTIPARRGRSTCLNKGQSIKIIDTHGCQMVDTRVLHAEDLTGLMSMDTDNRYASMRRPGLQVPVRPEPTEPMDEYPRCGRWPNAGGAPVSKPGD